MSIDAYSHWDERDGSFKKIQMLVSTKKSIMEVISISPIPTKHCFGGKDGYFPPKTVFSFCNSVDGVVRYSTSLGAPKMA